MIARLWCLVVGHKVKYMWCPDAYPFPYRRACIRCGKGVPL